MSFFLYALAAPVVLCGVVAYAMDWMDARKAKKEKSKFEEQVDKIPAKIPLTATPPKSLMYLYNILGSADEVIKNCDQMLNLTINNNLESSYKMNNPSLKKLVNNIKVDNFKKHVFDLDVLDEYFYYALEDKYNYSDSELDKIVADVSNSFKFNLKLVKLNGFGILKNELWFNLLFAVDVSYKFEGKEYRTKFPFVEDIALKIEEKDVKDIPEKELEKIYTYFNTKVIPNKNRIKNKKALDAPIEIKDVESFGPLGYKIDEYLSYHQTGCCWFAENNVLELIPSGEELVKESLGLGPSSEHLNLNTEQHIEYINSLNLDDTLTVEQFNNLTKALDGLGLEYDKNAIIYSNNRGELILEFFSNLRDHNDTVFKSLPTVDKMLLNFINNNKLSREDKVIRYLKALEQSKELISYIVKLILDDCNCAYNKFSVKNKEGAIKLVSEILFKDFGILDKYVSILSINDLKERDPFATFSSNVNSHGLDNNLTNETLSIIDNVIERIAKHHYESLDVPKLIKGMILFYKNIDAKVKPYKGNKMYEQHKTFALNVKKEISNFANKITSLNNKLDERV